MISCPVSTVPVQRRINFQAITSAQPDETRNLRPANQPPTLVIKRNKLLFRVSVRDILFIKSEHVYCRIFFTNDQRLLQRTSLEKLLERLPEDRFLRVHRSFAINVEHIRRYNSKKIYIGDTVITIGRTLRQVVAERLREMLG